MELQPLTDMWCTHKLSCRCSYWTWSGLWSHDVSPNLGHMYPLLVACVWTTLQNLFVVVSQFVSITCHRLRTVYITVSATEISLLSDTFPRTWKTRRCSIRAHAYNQLRFFICDIMIDGSIILILQWLKCWKHSYQIHDLSVASRACRKVVSSQLPKQV